MQNVVHIKKGGAENNQPPSNGTYKLMFYDIKLWKYAAAVGIEAFDRGTQVSLNNAVIRTCVEDKGTATIQKRNLHFCTGSLIIRRVGILFPLQRIFSFHIQRNLRIVSLSSTHYTVGIEIALSRKIIQLIKCA